MHLKLLTAAALAAWTLSAAPAGAQHRVAIGIPNAKSPDMIGSSPAGRAFAFCGGVDRDRDGHHGRRDGRVNCVVDSYAYADGEWALYNNRSWEPDSYNDWWHDRPDRAYPRWVQEQRSRGSCDPDRMWWSGSGWHC
jgi:hypothetical protein